MKVSLSEQDIIRAIEVYMALKGFKTGLDFNFISRKNDLQRVEFNVKAAKFDIEEIKRYANLR